ncbi:MAG: hypothetical protein JXL97_18550 [Bacteroidales bacterium]|nr:hypothetical protein [Bacteroidales bacterium]
MNTTSNLFSGNSILMIGTIAFVLFIVFGFVIVKMRENKDKNKKNEQ